MDSKRSVTVWIEQLKDDDPDAPARIWRRYGPELLRLAQSRLGTARKRVSDEEDIALAAFDAFCRGVQQGRFAKLSNRDDLWQVLVMLTNRKSIDHIRREARRAERGESVLLNPVHSQSGTDGIGRVANADPLPDISVQAMEQCERLLAMLNDETLRKVACWKLEGFTNDEIAAELGVVTRTVERKLGMIRRKWESEFATI